MEKILISVIIDLFKANGTSIRAKRVAEVLKNYYKITIVTRSDEKYVSDGFDDIDINVIEPSTTKLWNLKLISRIMQEKPDFVYCSNDYFGFLTYYLLSKIYHYHIIFEAHAIMSEELRGKNVNKLKLYFYTYLERYVITKSDFVVALSENTYNFYKQYNKNIELVTNFIDEELIKNIKTLKRNELKSKEIGLIGPFDNAGNEYFLEFLYGNIEKFDNDIMFTVIGKCENRIKNDRILYTGFIESRLDYINRLISLDAVLIPSKIPTLGPLTKIIESMAFSCPVFTTPNGIVGLDNVTNNEDILIFDIDGLVEGVNSSISNNQLMLKIATNSRITFEKYYSRMANEKKLLNVFKLMEE